MNYFTIEIMNYFTIEIMNYFISRYYEPILPEIKNYFITRDDELFYQ